MAWVPWGLCQAPPARFVRAGAPECSAAPPASGRHLFARRPHAGPLTLSTPLPCPPQHGRCLPGGPGQGWRLGSGQAQGGAPFAAARAAPGSSVTAHVISTHLTGAGATTLPPSTHIPKHCCCAAGVPTPKGRLSRTDAAGKLAPALLPLTRRGTSRLPVSLAVQAAASLQACPSCSLAHSSNGLACSSTAAWLLAEWNSC